MRCVDPGFKVDNLITLNAWYKHPGGVFSAPHHKEQVDSISITPTDWKMTPPCAIIRDLKYEFKVGNNWGGGTSDSLSISLGAGQKVAIGKNVDGGFTKTHTVHLKSTFGRDQVDIRDLKKVNVIDQLGSGKGDEWMFESMCFVLATLTAGCCGLKTTCLCFRYHVHGHLCRRAKEDEDGKVQIAKQMAQA